MQTTPWASLFLFCVYVRAVHVFCSSHDDFLEYMVYSEVIIVWILCTFVGFIYWLGILSYLKDMHVVWYRLQTQRSWVQHLHLFVCHLFIIFISPTGVLIYLVINSSILIFGSHVNIKLANMLGRFLGVGWKRATYFVFLLSLFYGISWLC